MKWPSHNGICICKLKVLAANSVALLIISEKISYCYADHAQDARADGWTMHFGPWPSCGSSACQSGCCACCAINSIPARNVATWTLRFDSCRRLWNLMFWDTYLYLTLHVLQIHVFSDFYIYIYIYTLTHICFVRKTLGLHGLHSSKK